MNRPPPMLTIGRARDVCNDQLPSCSHCTPEDCQSVGPEGKLGPLSTHNLFM